MPQRREAQLRNLLLLVTCLFTVFDTLEFLNVRFRVFESGYKQSTSS